MVALIGFWSHALAALLFGALSVWQLRHWNVQRHNRKLVAAFAVMAVWAIFVAFRGERHLVSGLAESARNFAFLSFMYGIVRDAEEDGRRKGLRLVYFAVAAVIGLQIVVAGVLPRFEERPVVYEALTATADLLGLTIATGSLVLVHNLYGQAAPDSRWGIRLPALALAGMWIYDLHLYTVAYLTHGGVDDLFAMRGAIAAMLVPFFALAIKRSNAEWKMRLSRAATFQSLSLMAILTYLIVMMSATQALAIIGGEWVRIGQIGIIYAMTVAAAILLPSGRTRAWLGVMLAKHFFEHRYDYREEWLRFTRAIDSGGADAVPLGDRVIKALADIAGAPAGLLLLAEDDLQLTPAARWKWVDPVEEGDAADAALGRFVEATGYVIAFDDAREGILAPDKSRIPVPRWLRESRDAWAGVPLIHNDRLVGLVILAHPQVRRALDWEDFDLFRTAGIQAANYLAEARSQEALASARRFDEFNRRFAFIMHDIKNLVSQLSLVTRNAERHADNPEFRADMIATLQSSVKKMNDLLARLDRGNGGEGERETRRPIAIHAIAAAVASAKEPAHPVALSGDPDLFAIADPARLEQALTHLVQNAIDASDAAEPVAISVSRSGSEALIEVTDRGCGMSAEFLRSRLFQPFASTKEGGFGIGAFEARTLVTAMGGRMEVESREGEGTRFAIYLPLGAASAAPQQERRRA